MPRAMIPCPSNAAYHRHRQEGQEACAGCREAHAAYVRARKAENRGRPRRRDAEILAMRALAARHPAEYQMLLNEMGRAIGVHLL